MSTPSNQDADFYWTLWKIFAAIFIGALPVLLYIPAPYGKFTRRGWGKIVSGRISWIIQESPCFFYSSYYLYTAEDISLEAFVLLCLFLIHYFHRSFFYGYLMSKDSKTTVPVVISAIFFNLVNGYLQVAGLSYYDRPNSSYYTARFWVGIFIWTFGYFGNQLSDYQLRTLRKPGEHGYKVPYGFFYYFVSCANYFTETIEWLGWAISCQNWSAWLFLSTTICNLLPRALSQHRWYLENFPDYHKLNRKAFIPYIL